MHYGEIEHRSIYGEASLESAKELIDEGIELHPLPALPDDQESLAGRRKDNGTNHVCFVWSNRGFSQKKDLPCFVQFISRSEASAIILLDWSWKKRTV